MRRKNHLAVTITVPAQVAASLLQAYKLINHRPTTFSGALRDGLQILATLYDNQFELPKLTTSEALEVIRESKLRMQKNTFKSFTGNIRRDELKEVSKEAIGAQSVFNEPVISFPSTASSDCVLSEAEIDALVTSVTNTKNSISSPTHVINEPTSSTGVLSREQFISQGFQVRAKKLQFENCLRIGLFTEDLSKMSDEVIAYFFSSDRNLLIEFGRPNYTQSELDLMHNTLVENPDQFKFL